MNTDYYFSNTFIFVLEVAKCTHEHVALYNIDNVYGSMATRVPSELVWPSIHFTHAHHVDGRALGRREELALITCTHTVAPSSVSVHVAACVLPGICESRGPRVRASVCVCVRRDNVGRALRERREREREKDEYCRTRCRFSV